MNTKLLPILAGLLLVPGLVFAQQGTVRGTVLDASTGESLPGASVQIPSEGIGAATDAEGNFSFRVPSGDYTIQASFVGYQDKSRTITVESGSSTQVRFELQPAQAEIGEVVVTGVSRGTETSKIGYSVDKVGSDQLENVPAENPADALRASVSGARVVRPSGEPGATPRVRLRGTVSITGSQDPLIVVDGAITQGSLEDIDMQNVKSIEVVKGAAAASLYGSLGANGVVQIITKTGAEQAEGETAVRVRNEVGFSQLANKIDLATHHNRGKIENGNVVNQYRPSPSESSSCKGAPCNPYSPLPGSLNVIDNDFSRTFDQQEELYTPQPFFTNYISFATNRGDLNYLVSFENLHQGGVIQQAEGYRRRNFRVNVGNQVTDWMKLDVSTLYSRQGGVDIDEQGQGDNVFYGTLLAAPDLDLDAPAPDSIDAPVNPFSNTGNASNPVYTLATNNETFQDERLLGNFKATFDLTDWLSFDGRFSYDREENQFSNYVRRGTLPASPTGSPSQGELFESSSVQTLTIGTGRILLSQDFGELSTDFTGTYTYEEREQEGFNTSGSEFLAADVPQFDNTISDNLSAGSFSSTILAENISGNLVLDYQDTYILDAVVRRDGLSLFGPEVRYQTYYRLSGTYRLTQDFDIPNVGQLKLRGTYGTAGDRPPFFAQYETFAVSPSGISKETLGNDEIEPVNLTEWTVGTDIAFLERFFFSGTYAASVADNQVLNVPLSAAAGFNSQWRNAGTLENSSLELSLRGTPIDQDDLTLSAGLTFSKVTQEVTELDRPAYTRNVGSAVSLFRVGENVPYGAIYGNQLASSIDQLRFNDNGELYGYSSSRSDTDDALTRDDLTVNDEGFVIEKGTQYTQNEQAFYVKDANGQKVTKQIGNTIPDFAVGFNTTLNYNNFTLHAVADWEKGADVYNYTKQLLIFNQRAGVVDQADEPEGERHNMSYYLSGPYNQSDPSSYFVENGSYLKLREVSLGYTISQNLLQGIGIGDQLRQAELSVSGRNLFTITPYSGYDPEVSVQSGDGDTQPTNFKVDDFGYPNFRSYTFSLELLF